MVWLPFQKIVNKFEAFLTTLFKHFSNLSGNQLKCLINSKHSQLAVNKENSCEGGGIAHWLALLLADLRV